MRDEYCTTDRTQFILIRRQWPEMGLTLFISPGTTGALTLPIVSLVTENIFPPLDRRETRRGVTTPLRLGLFRYQLHFILNTERIVMGFHYPIVENPPGYCDHTGTRIRNIESEIGNKFVIVVYLHGIKFGKVS